jgi:integrase
MQVLTTDQARKVIEESAGSSYGLAILLGLATGCRRGELCALKWRNVDLDKGLIRIIESTTQVRAELFTGPTKNSRPRSITLPAMAIEALRRARIQQAQTQLMMGIRIGPESFVCCWPDGSRLRPIAFSNYARRLFDRLGLPVHLHSLRHTHATALLLAGVHPKTAQDRLGHSKISLTMDLYSHVTDALRDEAAEKIDAVLRG